MSSGSFGVRFRSSGAAAGRIDASAPTVGKQTLVEQLADAPAASAPVQRKLAAGPDAANLDPGRVHEIATAGTRGPGSTLPHLGTIQRLFGRHDVTGVRAHDGEAAAASATAIGAAAYATGDRVAFAGAPDLHTAAHEAAHVVQQRGGVQLKAAVGQAGDDHERHADAVADAVVQGRSAEPLLDRYAAPGPSPAAGAVQRIILGTSGPYKSFGVVKGQLTRRGIILKQQQLDALEDIFDRTDLRLSLDEALQRVQGDDGERKNTNDDEQGTPKINDNKRRLEKTTTTSTRDRDDDHDDKRRRKLENKVEKRTDKTSENTDKKEKKDKSVETRRPTREKHETQELSDDEHSDSEHDSIDFGTMTIGEAVLAALRDTGITDRGILCLLVDPAIDSLEDLLEFEPEATSPLKEGSVDAPVRLHRNRRVGWVAYTSCYNTAGALLDKLGTGANLAMTGTKRGDILQLSAQKAQEVIANTLQGLLGAITSVGNGRAIFRIHYGIHGFAIVIRNQCAELLESFAGTSGHSFLQGLEAHPTYSIPALCGLLGDMAGSKKSKRGTAMDTLFGGGILDDDNVWPKVELLWNCGQLISDPEILAFFRTMITSRAKELARRK